MSKERKELFDEYVKLWKEYRQMDEYANVIRKEANKVWEKYYNYNGDEDESRRDSE